MHVISQSVEYALSDIFMTCWYILAISTTITPIIVATVHDWKNYYRNNWMERGLILTGAFFIISIAVLVIANFTCATPTGYYTYTALFDDIETQTQVFSNATDIEYVDGIYKFRSMIDYGN